MTPQPHDFKEAIKFAEQCKRLSQEFPDIRGSQGKSWDTVIFALRLAERVCGETTYEMRQAGSQKVGSDFEVRGTFGIAQDVFKAMISEALKEIENGKP